MIKKRLDEVMQERKLTLHALSVKSGIPVKTLWTITTERTKGISDAVLDRLCKALGCQPGDLLVFIDEEAEVARNGTDDR